MIKKAILILTMMAASPAFAQDATQGQKVFNACKACHAIAPGMNRVGPSLHGFLDRGFGKASGFKYSPAMSMQADGLNGNIEDSLQRYLKEPKGTVRGNRMAFAGIKRDKDLLDVIAYLKTLK